MIFGDNPGVAAILRALPPAAHAVPEGDHVRVTSGKYEWLFRSVWIGEGFPSDLMRSDRSEDPSERNAVNVFTARRISSGTKQRLEARDASWADLTGRAHITAAPGFLVDRLFHERPRISSGLKWSTSAGAIVEVLLQQHTESTRAGVSEPSLVHADNVSFITGVSYPQVNKVLQQLETDGHIEKQGTRGSSVRRRLTNPSRLLSAWAGWHKDQPRQGIELHALWRTSERSIEVLESHLRRNEWAVTDWVASDLVAPFATSVPSLACYVAQPKLAQLIDQLTTIDGMERTEDGGRLTLIPAEPHVLRMSDTDRDIPVVYAVRLYGDLVRLGGRGEEAAEHLREVTLGY